MLTHRSYHAYDQRSPLASASVIHQVSNLALSTNMERDTELCAALLSPLDVGSGQFGLFVHAYKVHLNRLFSR